MSTEVKIAVITSITSLLVAIVSLVNSIINSRQSAKSVQSIEILKHEFVEKQARQAFHDKYLDRSIESLDVLIQTVQQFKDFVQLILGATGTSMDSESALESISESRLELFEVYEKHMANLEPLEARGAHKAKNTARAIETRLLQDLQSTSFVSELSEQQKQTLVELRSNLTENQNLLRDSKTTRLAKRIQAI